MKAYEARERQLGFVELSGDSSDREEEERHSAPQVAAPYFLRR